MIWYSSLRNIFKTSLKTYNYYKGIQIYYKVIFKHIFKEKVSIEIILEYYIFWKTFFTRPKIIS